MTNRLKSVQSGIALLAVLGLSGVMAVSPGCKKKEPPPPPPPPYVPPPPPPPATVHLASLRDGMSLDARVQTADDVEVLDERLGMAILEFADAIVRGDPGEVSTWLAQDRGRSVLDELLNTGLWDETIAEVEAVRIVYVTDTGAGDAPTPADDGEAKMREMEEAVRRRVESSEPIDGEFLRSLFGDVPDEFKSMVEPMLRMMDQMPAMTDPSAKQFFLSNFQRGLDSAKKHLNTMSSFSGDSVTMAFQFPGEAYLVRWEIGRTGSGFVFSGLSSIADTRPRASDFDGVSGAVTFAGPAMPRLPDLGPGMPNIPLPTQRDQPGESGGGPPTRSTPGGPITIPGS